jgi:hypothetical protein
MRIRLTRDRPDLRGRIGGITSAGQWTRQLGLRCADDETEHGVECGQTIVVG